MSCFFLPLERYIYTGSNAEEGNQPNIFLSPSSLWLTTLIEVLMGRVSDALVLKPRVEL